MPTECVKCGGSAVLPIEGVRDFEFGITYPGHLQHCNNCQTVSLVPLPSDDELSGLYNAHYLVRPLPGKILYYLFELLMCLTILRKTKRLSPQRILDVGCGNGEILKMFSKLGKFELWGVDIDLQQPREGMKLISGSFEEVDLPPAYFDIIILNNVLEHIRNPKRLLAKCSGLLRTNGVVYGETPITNKLGRKWAGKYWFGYHFPRHVVLFSEAGLKETAQLAGLEVIEIKAAPHPGTWAMAIQYLLNDLGVIRSGRKLFTYSLMILFFPLSCLEALAGQGEVVRFLLRRSTTQPT